MNTAQQPNFSNIFRWIRRSPQARGQLPGRVREAIGRQQDESELLIGWIQLAIVLIFGSLYAVSPKAKAGFDLAPWALAIYLAVTIIRLVWAHRSRLPDWSLALSILFDMTLLMSLIWSFHLKYDQPASFYLKAPTLLYVFIFVSLRALRFEARFVVLAGLVAALGWAMLIGYVLFGDANPMITRDYVAYLTSNSILIGGEIDKLLSILTVTVVMAVSLSRAKGLLVQSVVEETASRELSRFFSPEVARRIKATDSEILPGHGEMRDAAILNIDMRGFTRFAADAEPDAVIRILSDYQARLVPIIRAHGGAVDKFLGDGILATFGAVTPSPSFAADALAALDAIISEARQWAREFPEGSAFRPIVNGAVASGNILFGAVGSVVRLEYTVIGNAVNLSAKLEKANKALDAAALCDAPTYRLAMKQGYQPAKTPRQVNRVRIDGLAVPIDLVVLADAAARAETPADAPAA